MTGLWPGVHAPKGVLQTQTSLKMEVSTREVVGERQCIHVCVIRDVRWLFICQIADADPQVDIVDREVGLPIEVRDGVRAGTEVTGGRVNIIDR